VKITGKATATAATAAAAAATGLAFAGLRRSRVRPETADAGKAPGNAWRAVTVNKPAEKLQGDGTLPAPLAALGDRFEVRIARARMARAPRSRSGHGEKTTICRARE
jgi:hypothetical protein